MTDQTTQGYEADPDEVEGLLGVALGDIPDEPDLTIRYTLLSKQLVLHDAVVTAIADERARTVASMSSPGGMSYAQIADALQMSRPRAQQLVQRGKATIQTTPEAPVTTLDDIIGRIQNAAWANGAELAEGIDFESAAKEIRDAYGLVDVDTIPADEFWAIVRKHDTTQQG